MKSSEITMSLNVGDVINIDIESLNYSPYSVGRKNGFVVFVDGGVPGDKLKVRIINRKKNYAIAELLEVITPSEHRIEPPCKHFLEGCGGCQWQHVDYLYQTSWKKEILRQSLIRIGRLSEFPEIRISPATKQLNYRDRFRLSPTIVQNKLLFGMNRHNSHQVVPIERCLLAVDQVNMLSPIFVGEAIPLTSHISELSIYASPETGQMMVCCSYDKADPTEAEVDAENLSKHGPISSIYAYYKKGSTYELKRGKETISRVIKRIEYMIGPDTFFQVNAEGAKNMVELVRRYIPDGCDLVIDAHCGVGTFALQIADLSARTYGTDICASAIKLARANATLNGIQNVFFIEGNISKLIGSRVPKDAIDVVILDPPRGGCQKDDLKSLISAKPSRIIYISCNPTTLARDLNQIVKTGYEIKEISMIDMFPMTYHVECIVLMDR